MSGSLHCLSLLDQAAAHLREGIQSGRWVGQLPGVLQIARELAVSKHAVRAALKALEAEGLIEDRGAGRRKKILADRIKKPACRPLRFGILLYQPLEEEEGRVVKVVLGIRHAIEVAGHVCVISDRTLTQLKDNPSRISRLVKAVDADAWIALVASRVVLEWFIAQSLPVYAWGGRFQDLPVASSSTRLAPAIESAVNRLMDQGHRRIVMLAATAIRKPTPVPSLEKFLSLLEARGIVATDYHLPHFEESTEGLESCLDALFRITPPTALIVDQTSYSVAAFFFLARRGLQVPRDVSVICTDMEPCFQFCQPPLDHFERPVKETIASIIRWVKGVAEGRSDKLQMAFDAVYIPGGTVGPAKK